MLSLVQFYRQYASLKISACEKISSKFSRRNNASCNPELGTRDVLCAGQSDACVTGHRKKFFGKLFEQLHGREKFSVSLLCRPA
jgi:hypothetical protein